MKGKESILACFWTVTVLLLFIYILFELIGVKMNDACRFEKIIILIIIILLLVLVGILAGQCLSLVSKYERLAMVHVLEKCKSE